MTDKQSSATTTDKSRERTIKCVVWDLDNTIWEGVLLEDTQCSLRPDVTGVIKALDDRGILNSIASRNENAAAMLKLSQLGLDEYFLYPQINWNSKVTSIKAIAQAINIGLDAIAFIDDQSFERDEVAYSLPEVLCIDARDVYKILDMPALNPHFVSDESKSRRLMYIHGAKRTQAERDFIGSSEEFLATLEMVFTISLAKEDDLQRAEELTVRTHQLNTTGYTYSCDELNAFRQSDNYKLLIATLDDKYGTYGKIGLALVECGKDIWTIKLLLMSCRVISRGVGTILLTHIMQLARKDNVRLHAEFVPNDRNRMMYITYKFGGFYEVKKLGKLVLLENNLTHIQAFPKYITTHVSDES
jgi:FkbH-like protein